MIVSPQSGQLDLYFFNGKLGERLLSEGLVLRDSFLRRLKRVKQPRWIRTRDLWIRKPPLNHLGTVAGPAEWNALTLKMDDEEDDDGPHDAQVGLARNHR